MTTTRQLQPKVIEWIDNAVIVYALDESVTWDATYLLGPNNEPIFYLMLFVPGPILGTIVSTGVAIQNLPLLQETDLADLVKQMVGTLLSERTKQATVLQPPPKANGAPRILPPQ